MALRAAKQLYPNLEITFVARERFAAAAKRVPWIHEVITFPSDELLGPVLRNRASQEEALGDLAGWIAPLVKSPWDFLLNWSYSNSSSYLTALIPSRVKLGFSRRPDLEMSCMDGWSQYIQGVVQGRAGQNIHLTDILTTQLLTALQIHVGEPVDEGNSPVTSKSFFTLELGTQDLRITDHSRKWIAIQLGAGNAAKTWDPENYGALANLILNRHSETAVVVMGGAEDQSRFDRMYAQIEDKSRVLSLVGQTDFDLWASVVGRAQWVIAGDTAAIHLASVLGTRVLNISVGPVAWAETGPYGNGHYVLSSAKPCDACKDLSREAEPIAHTCRTNVTPEAAYATWSYASSEWSHRRQNLIERHFSQLGFSHDLPLVRIHRARIRNSNDGGGVLYEPMTQSSMDLQDWMSGVIGHIARSWYCGWVPPIGQELSRDRISPQLIQKLRELNDSSLVLSQIWGEAQTVSAQLSTRSAKLKSDKVMNLSDRNQLAELGKKLQELDTLADRLIKTHASLQAFMLMSQVVMHNLRGEHLSEIGKESSDAYKQLGDGVKILRDWLKYTLDLAKPMAVKPELVRPAAEIVPN